MSYLYISLMGGPVTVKLCTNIVTHAAIINICMVFEIIINPIYFHFCIHYPLANAFLMHFFLISRDCVLSL